MWVEDDRIETLELCNAERTPEQIARFGRERSEAGSRGCGALERGKRDIVIIHGEHVRRFRKPQRKRADAGEQVGDIRGVVAGFDD